MIASRLQCCAPVRTVNDVDGYAARESRRALSFSPIAFRAYHFRAYHHSLFPSTQEITGGRMKKFMLIFAMPLLFSVLGSAQNTPVSTSPDNNDDSQPRMFFP